VRIPVWEDYKTGMPSEWTAAHHYFLDELEKIAMSGMDSEVSEDLDDNQSAPDTAAVSGVLIRCEKCGCGVKDQQPKFCPRCGTPIKTAPPGDKPPGGKATPFNGDGGTLESGPTGGQAATEEELSDMGKYSMHPLLMKLQGAAALGVGGYGGYKVRGLLNKNKKERQLLPPGHMKMSGVAHKKGSRFSAFNLHRRGGNYGSVQEGLDRIALATAKHARKLPVV